MEFMHELVMAVVGNASQAFDEAGLPPAAIVDLKETWLSKLDARGMFDAGPSPFPPVTIPTRELYKLRCAFKKKAHHHRSAHEPSSAEPAATDGGAMLPPGSGPAAGARTTLWSGATAGRSEIDESGEYGRPQSARAPPRTASLPLAASRVVEVLPAAASLPLSGAEPPPHHGQMSPMAQHVSCTSIELAAAVRPAE